MSLYSSLTQVLAPFAAKINGLLTGWDGTTYTTPGEAVRQQISDLHVLIGDVPGVGVSGSAVSYDGTDSGLSATDMQSAVDEVSDALSSTNERLGDLKNTFVEEQSHVLEEFTNASFRVSAFKQGARKYTDLDVLNTNNARCSSSVFYLLKGDTVHITGLATGQRFALLVQGKVDTGWITQDYDYTAVYDEKTCIIVSNTDGSAITPEDIAITCTIYRNSFLSTINRAEIANLRKFIVPGEWDSATGNYVSTSERFCFLNYLDDVISIVNANADYPFAIRYLVSAYDAFTEEYVGTWNDSTKAFEKKNAITAMLLYSTNFTQLRKMFPAYRFKVTIIPDGMTTSEVLSAIKICYSGDRSKVFDSGKIPIEYGYYAIADGTINNLSYSWCKSIYPLPYNCVIKYTNAEMILVAYEGESYIGAWDKTNQVFTKTYNVINLSLAEINVFDFHQKYPQYTFYLDVRGPASGLSISYVLENTTLSYDSGDQDSSVLPGYYSAYMQQKNDAIQANINSTGINGETFIFITDLHWESNYKKSPMLIDDIIKNTNTHILVCGGDIVSRNVKAVVKQSMMDCVKAFEIPSYPMHMTFGNHDSNAINWTNQEDIATNALSANEVFGMSQKGTSYTNTYITDSGINYYFDRKDSKTRFIVLDTGINSTYTSETIPALCETLNTTPSGYKIVIVQHWYFNGISAETASLTSAASMLMDIVSQYNSRGSYTNDGETYSFASAAGEIVLMIGGHTHYDYVLPVDDSRNIAGVPIVCVNCDSYRDNPTAIEGTTSEQCFDVVTLNYETRKIDFVRIGRGENRSVSY